MPVQQTSLIAYYDVVLNTLNKRQSTVYYWLCRCTRAVSNRELCEILKKFEGAHWEINTVVPRVNELRKAKLVEFVGKSKCYFTKQKVMKWKAIKYDYVSLSEEAQQIIKDKKNNEHVCNKAN